MKPINCPSCGSADIERLDGDGFLCLNCGTHLAPAPDEFAALGGSGADHLAVHDAERQLAQGGHLLEAIRAYRERTGVSLKQAKLAIESGAPVARSMNSRVWMSLAAGLGFLLAGVAYLFVGRLPWPYKLVVLLAALFSGVLLSGLISRNRAGIVAGLVGIAVSALIFLLLALANFPL
mgnify:CR=1 FL=1